MTTRCFDCDIVVSDPSPGQMLLMRPNGLSPWPIPRCATCASRAATDEAENEEREKRRESGEIELRKRQKQVFVFIAVTIIIFSIAIVLIWLL